MLSLPRISAILAVIVLAFFAACSQEANFEEVYTRVSEGVLRPGDPIPIPQQEVILTVNGKIGTTNTAAAIVMDRPTLEQVGLVEYSVQDPFADRQIRYRGVLMRDLLDLWQATNDVEMVHLTALNDYQVDIPVAEFRQYPILFAMQADGTYMEPDYQGPAMLVFPVDSYSFDELVIRQRWIWQIKSIELK
ncbi:MAG TPA: hypothetical protein P5121_39050 [Caldilineaceae bacterium]|nr:hypothetical protein [Caldilineaceae bacterium]